MNTLTNTDLMKFRSKNLLVTGGLGFIGSNFINNLLQKNYEIRIINLDAVTYAASPKNIIENRNHLNYKFIKGNICDKKLLEEVFKEYQIDGVINFAAETHVDNSINNPEIFIETNINGVFNLLSVSYNFWMTSPFTYKSKFKNSRFHQISTDEVYGSILKGSFNENSNYMPSSPYSASKAGADMLVKSFQRTYGLNTTISISSNNFGKNQNFEKFIPKVIKCLIDGEKIPVYGSGKNIRDWIYVLDNCDAIEKIYNNSKNGETYNVGSGNEYSNNQILEKIYCLMKKHTETQKKVVFVKDRYGHDFRYSMSSSKIFKDLGWTPKYDFDENLENYIIKKINNE